MAVCPSGRPPTEGAPACFPGTKPCPTCRSRTQRSSNEDPDPRRFNFSHPHRCTGAARKLFPAPRDFSPAKKLQPCRAPCRALRGTRPAMAKTAKTGHAGEGSGPYDREAPFAGARFFFRWRRKGWGKHGGDSMAERRQDWQISSHR